MRAIGEISDEKIKTAKTNNKFSNHYFILKVAIAACLCLVISSGFFSLQNGNGDVPYSLVIAAYAADGTSYELGKEPINISDDMSFSSGFNSRFDEGNGHGRDSFMFDIVAKDDNVESVSYTINDEINAQNALEMKANKAWFATQELTAEMAQSAFPIYATRRSAEGTYSYSYIGNTYSETYPKQNASTILEYRIEHNDQEWHADSISIDAKIRLSDGTTIKKEIVFSPTYSEFGRKMQISCFDA